MRILMVLALMMSISAFAQRVKENVKQQAVINGSSANVNTFPAQPGPQSRPRK